jgi:Flp pilus assembly protein TadG
MDLAATPRMFHRRGLHEEQGQSLIEAAFAVPVFCLLLFGIFSFAFVLFGWCNITFGSRSAVRYASIHSNTALVPATSTSVTTYVTPFLYAVPTNSSTTVVSYPASNPSSTPVNGSSALNTIGGTVTVSVTATYSVTMPFTSFKTFTVASSAKRTISR